MILQHLFVKLGCQQTALHGFSRMLCDEHIVACLIALSCPAQSQERPAMLDQQKETGK
jgi:hypothetical protein